MTEESPKFLVHYKADTGYSWVIAASCLVILAFVIGIFRSYGVIYYALLNVYGLSREQASWPLTLTFAIMNLTGIISGTLSNCLSTRTIVICGSLLSSLGVALCYFATSIVEITVLIGGVQGFGSGLVVTQVSFIINQYFVKLRATANGLALAGGTIGAFIFPPIVELMLFEYSINGCFLILGALMLNTLPAAMLLKAPEPPKKVLDNSSIALSNRRVGINIYGSKEDVSKELSDKLIGSNAANDREETTELRVNSSKENETHVSTEIKNGACRVKRAKKQHVLIALIKNPPYLTICILQAIFMWTWTSFTLVIVDFANGRGIPLREAVILLSAFPGADLLGRLTFGWISDKGIVKRRIVAFISISLLFILSCLTPLADSYISFIFISLAFGIFTGSMIILFNPLIAECVEMSTLPVALGAAYSVIGLAALLRPLAVGYFRDVHGSYDGLFYTMGGSCLFASLLWLPQCFTRTLS